MPHPLGLQTDGTLVADKRSYLSRWGADQAEEVEMSFGKGALLWLIGIPIPIILLIAVLWHH
jgi:hypothetical protein